MPGTRRFLTGASTTFGCFLLQWPHMAQSPTPNDDNADAFLIRQIRSGDQRAWRQLIERYSGRLLAFARTRLGKGSDAEDALQETFLGFVSSLRHFDEDRSLETYLFAILRYKIRELIEKRRRQPETLAGFDVDDDDPAAAIEAVEGETPSAIAARREQSRAASLVIADVLRRLTEELCARGKLEDVQVVELLFFVGLRNKEAGERLGRDEKAVAGVKFRALGRLREFLDEAVRDGRFDPASMPVDDLLTDDSSISQIWRRNRISCVKRSTMGSYLLGALDEQWEAFTRFHLEDIGCLMCRANLEDLSGPEGEAIRQETAEQWFASSVGFLSRT